MNIKVLGPGCKNCTALERATAAAMNELGLDSPIEKVSDYAEIASYGVMNTPALVIGDEVKVAGRVPDVAELKALISSSL